QQGDEDRENRDEPTGAEDLTQDAVGRGRRGVVALHCGHLLGLDRLGHLALGRDLLLVAHAAAPVVSPAIMRPRTSRGVSPGTIPTMPPRYMTAMRSASAVTSSSSVDTTITGMPESRASTTRVCTNSMEPT